MDNIRDSDLPKGVCVCVVRDIVEPNDAKPNRSVSSPFFLRLFFLISVMRLLLGLADGYIARPAV